MQPLLLSRPKKSYKSLVLGYSPVAFWPCDETSGSTAYDKSGHSYNSTFSSGTLASGVIRGKPVWTDNATDGYIDMYSSALNTNWPRSAGTLLIWTTFTGTWTEAVERYLWRIYINGNNKIAITKTSTAKCLSVTHNQGGWNNGFSYMLGVHPDTAPFCFAFTWDSVAQEARYFFNGSKIRTITGTLALAGNLISAYSLFGAFGTTPSQCWPGPIGFASLFGSALTDAQIARLSVANLQAPTVYDDGFSFVHIGDIFQQPSSSSAQYWVDLPPTQWIIDNATKYNIKGVEYTGDLVETVTDPNAWAATKAAFDLLAATEIPYHACAGNHDYTDLANRVKASFDTDYPQSRYTGHGWYNGGFYEANKSENMYYIISYGGQDYMILSLEEQPRSAVRTWASDLLTANPSKKVLLFTHEYMDQDAVRYSCGTQIWDDVVKTHDNVILVCCGHAFTKNAAYRVDNSNGGKPVHQLFF